MEVTYTDVPWDRTKPFAIPTKEFNVSEATVQQIIDAVFAALEASSLVSGNIFLKLAVTELGKIVDDLLPTILGNLGVK